MNLVLQNPVVREQPRGPLICSRATEELVMVTWHEYDLSNLEHKILSDRMVRWLNEFCQQQWYSKNNRLFFQCTQDMHAWSCTVSDVPPLSHAVAVVKLDWREYRVLLEWCTQQWGLDQKTAWPQGSWNRSFKAGGGYFWKFATAEQAAEFALLWT
jgi:hypothetical protein